MYKPKNDEWVWYIETNSIKQLIPTRAFYQEKAHTKYFWVELIKQGNLFKTKKDALAFIKKLKKP